MNDVSKKDKNIPEMREKVKMENKSWFVHVEWAVLLITLIGGFYVLDAKIERAHERSDRIYESNTQKWHEAITNSNQRWEDLLNKYTELKCENAVRGSSKVSSRDDEWEDFTPQRTKL